MADAAFMSADTNHDGYVSRDEFFASYILSKHRHSTTIDSVTSSHQGKLFN